MLTLEQLASIAHQHSNALAARVQEFTLGEHYFNFNSKPAIMGVINLSPDSWYRESVCPSLPSALRRGKTLHAQGAHIIDIGAESTLANAQLVSNPQQTSKLIPVITGLREANILVSAETYHLSVAQACLKAGANLINLTGTDRTDKLYRTIADHDAAVIICFVQGPNVREVGDFDLHADPIPVLYDYFAGQIELATRCGLKKILLDPGLGFYYRNLQDSATRVQHQITTFLNTFRLRTLGFPICHALPHALDYFAEEVRSAEPFFATLAALGKTDLFRTHEVPRVKAVLDTLQTLQTPSTPSVKS